VAVQVASLACPKICDSLVVGDRRWPPLFIDQGAESGAFAARKEISHHEQLELTRRDALSATGRNQSFSGVWINCHAAFHAPQ